MTDEAPLDVAGRVAAAAAHDVNNHLAAISLQAELALEAASPDDEKLRRRLQGILSSCGHARELTRGLLAFGGRRALHPAPVDVAAALRRVGGERVTVAAGDRPLVVDVDPDVLDEALTHLVSPDRDGETAVAARADGDLVELRFTSVGPEPDEQTSRRFFEPFATEDDALGLAAVYGFVRQSGGTIALDRTGVGAEVVLRLPRA